MLCIKGRKTATGRKENCADCCQHAYVPVSDEEIERHLKGLQTIGIFPLLLDETCWFLAVDFDQGTWREDVGAFSAACGSHNVPVAIERSRSGNGAHAWIFFSEPVASGTARSLGCFMITESMIDRHQLTMSSYDRLFPNQDTLPKGGFGNLIALPLQRQARANGNSVFVDESLKPYPDQWAFLAGVRKIDEAFARETVQEAARQGRVMGLREVDSDETLHQTPWRRPPSGYGELSIPWGSLPREVRGAVSQKLFIENTGLPSAALNQIKRLAAFQNPEFYKRQSMRLSTALIPRVIACAEELPEYIALPRGCLSDAEVLLSQCGASLSLEEKREEGTPLDCTFRGDLTALQEKAAKAMLAHDFGVLVSPPGSGKTVVGIYLIAMRGRNTLILVHRKPIFDQWVAQLALFLGKEPKEIGQFGSGKSRSTGILDVAMMQSLVRQGRVADCVARYGHVVVDECHHVPAVSFERILSEVKAKFVTGLTATPRRRDGLQPILHMQLGPVRFSAASPKRNSPSPLSQTLIVRETDFDLTSATGQAGIQELYGMLSADLSRNALICADILRILAEGRSPIVLTERRDHLERLGQELQKDVPGLVVLHGAMKTSARRDALASLARAANDIPRLLLSTGRYIGEGFDDARLDTLFLTMPVAWKGTLIQYAGRLSRPHQGKRGVRIYDYVDSKVPVLRRMFQKRLRGYASIGYQQRENDSDEELDRYGDQNASNPK